MLDAAPVPAAVLGPNCIGLLTPRLGSMPASPTPMRSRRHRVRLAVGRLVTAVLDWAKARRIGFSTMVSLGRTRRRRFRRHARPPRERLAHRSILLYIESIEAPRKFMSAARAAARNKPVIVVKAGRAGNGVKAAASHTGALAGSDIVFDAAIRRAGMLRVDTLQDLFMAAETLARFGANRDAPHADDQRRRRGVMAADAAALAGIPLHDLRRATRASWTRLPPTWSRGNPIDIIGDAPVQRYTDTLQALLADAGAAPCCSCTRRPRSCAATTSPAPALRSCAGAGRVMACWLGDGAVAEARRSSRRRGRGLRDARGGRARLRPARHVSAQPGAAARDARRQRQRLAADRRRTAHHRRGAGRGAHDAREDEAKHLLKAYASRSSTPPPWVPTPTPRPQRPPGSAIRSP
jgi:acetyltransferase